MATRKKHNGAKRANRVSKSSIGTFQQCGKSIDKLLSCIDYYSEYDHEKASVAMDVAANIINLANAKLEAIRVRVELRAMPILTDDMVRIIEIDKL